MFRLNPTKYSLDKLQKTALSLMTVLALITFLGTNLQAILWQSSDWLVGTVLPSVVIDLTNEQRADLNAAPLKRNAALDEAARLKAEHMAKNQYFAHYAPDGTTPWHWFDEAGYVYAHAGENLAIHFTDSSEVVEAWMDSPTHRSNIVDPKYTEIGVGTAKGKYEGYNTVYVVQLFGTPGVTRFAQSEPTPAPTPAPASTPVPTPTPSPELAIAPSPTSEPVAVAVTERESVPVREVEPVFAVDTPEVLADAEDLESEMPADFTPEGVPEPVPVPESRPLPEPIRITENPINNSVIIERPIIATSSGLAVANYTEANTGHNAGQTRASLATQPNTLLQAVYIVLGLIAFTLLIISVVMEARQLRYIQVTYSFLLLLGMGGLWFIHSVLTEGAVIL